MGRALAESYRIARATFDEADAILGFPLSRLCFEGPADELTLTVNAQPALLTTAIAAFRAFREAHPGTDAPVALAGHSLGEYSALVAGGAMQFADAVRLTRARGVAMAAAGASQPGSMAAILKLDDAQVAALCEEASRHTGEVVQVANYNAPGQVVISGSPAAVTHASELAQTAGGRPRLLAVTVASHSPLMADAQADLAAAVSGIAFRTPDSPVISNLEARELVTPESIRHELVAQLTRPVRWTDTVQELAVRGVDCFVEFGPGEVLTGLVKRIVPAARTFNVRDHNDIASFTA
jgi:[acyl-carrier-protein] S-malonyltransferase